MPLILVPKSPRSYNYYIFIYLLGRNPKKNKPKQQMLKESDQPSRKLHFEYRNVMNVLNDSNYYFLWRK